MYITQPGVVARARRAKRAARIWRYARPQKVEESDYEINPFNRGVAIVGTPAVRRHARRGAGRARRANRTAAVGNAGRRHDARLQPDERAAGREGQGARRNHRRRVRRTRISRRLRRGARGRRLWRWYAVPAPGEFGNDTWKGDSWKLGGSPMWLTGSYDPDLNLVYWTVGNPGPQIDRSTQGRSRQPVQRFGRGASIPTPASANGTISSRPTTATTGTRARPSFSSTACGTGNRESCCCTPIATACFYVLDRTDGSLPRGTPLRLSELEQRNRRQREAPRRARVELEPAKAASSSIRRSSARRTSRRPHTVP